MLSKPSFEVDIVKGNGSTLSFTCSYVHADEVPPEAEGQGQFSFSGIYIIYYAKYNGWNATWKIRERRFWRK